MSDSDCPSSSPYCHDHLCRVCWDGYGGREGCDIADEYCDIEEDRCVPFTGYTFKENYACNSGYDAAHYTLDEALDNCNSNVGCKCIDYSKGRSIYYTYTASFKIDALDWDAWVKT